MKFFIINLKKSVDRKKYMESQLTPLGVDYSFIEAFEPGTDRFNKISRYNNKKRLNRTGYPMSGGEIGCFASHYYLWKNCVALDETIVALEDDLILSNDFSNTVNELEKLIKDYKYIKLHGLFEYKRCIVEKLSGNRAIVKYFKPPAGTQGYILTPAAAKRFLDKANEWYEPVDNYMDRFWFHGIECYTVVPSAVVEIDHDNNTVIERSKKPHLPLLQKIKKEILRGSADAIMYLHNIIFMMKKFFKLIP